MGRGGSSPLQLLNNNNNNGRHPHLPFHPYAQPHSSYFKYLTPPAGNLHNPVTSLPLFHLRSIVVRDKEKQVRFSFADLRNHKAKFDNTQNSTLPIPTPTDELLPPPYRTTTRSAEGPHLRGQMGPHGAAAADGERVGVPGGDPGHAHQDVDGACGRRVMCFGGGGWWCMLVRLSIFDRSIITTTTRRAAPHTQAHDTAIKCMQWSHNGNFMLTGARNGVVKYWARLNAVSAFDLQCVLFL